MSLVGSLEDLSLGDILQIISLSQKSGVLSLQTNGCEGRIVFIDGLVRGAQLKNGPQGMHGLLVDSGFIDQSTFDAATARSKETGESVAVAVEAVSALSSERVESIQRESTEVAVVQMFAWGTGNFSFDVRPESEIDDPDLLPTGINSQYLAMEAARQSDEGPDVASSGAAEDEAAGEAEGAGFDEMSAHELFGVAPDAESHEPVNEPFEGPPVTATDTLAMATAQRVDDPFEAVPGQTMPDSGHSWTDESDAVLLDDVAEAPLITHLEPEPLEADLLDCDFEDEATLGDELTLSEALPEELEALSARPTATPDATTAVASEPATPVTIGGIDSSGALVVLDDDLVALEWVKSALHCDFEPIHIFQHMDQALTRVRQYLVRGRPPVLLVSWEAKVDSMAGIRDTADFVARLKEQSPGMTILWLREDGSASSPRKGAADGMVTRLEHAQLRAVAGDAEAEEQAADFARQVRSAIGSLGSPPEAAALSESSRGPSETLESAPQGPLDQLHATTRALMEASSRGEILPVAIRFAAEIFQRVAMFLVHDGTAVGIAQQGLPLAGGPTDADLRDLSFEVAASGWLTSVLAESKPYTGPPRTDGDRALASLIGDRVPDEVYLAPIESTGQVIAVIYGDNLPSDQPIGDTSALEVVLQHAGLALDRAALERALHEHDAEG